MPALDTLTLPLKIRELVLMMNFSSSLSDLHTHGGGRAFRGGIFHGPLLIHTLWLMDWFACLIVVVAVFALPQHSLPLLQASVRSRSSAERTPEKIILLSLATFIISFYNFWLDSSLVLPCLTSYWLLSSRIMYAMLGRWSLLWYWT